MAVSTTAACFHLHRLPIRPTHTANPLALTFTLRTKPSLYNPLYNSNTILHAPMVTTSAALSKLPTAIKSSLIDPDGGTLVDLVTPVAKRPALAAEAETLPKVKIGKVDLEWVHVISEGWASPLRGFMREDEYLHSLHFNSFRLQDGSVVNMSLPIVLAIDDQDKVRIGASGDVALQGPSGHIVAILRRFHSFSPLTQLLILLRKIKGRKKKKGIGVLSLCR